MRCGDADASRRSIWIGQLEDHLGVGELRAGERHPAAITDLHKFGLACGLKSSCDPAAAAACARDAIEDELKGLGRRGGVEAEFSGPLGGDLHPQASVEVWRGEQGRQVWGGVRGDASGLRISCLHAVTGREILRSNLDAMVGDEIADRGGRLR